MIVTFRIAEKLIPYVEGASEKEINRIMNLMLELAIKNGLLEYPDTYLERNVKIIKSELSDLKLQQNLLAESVRTQFASIINILQSQVKELPEMETENIEIEQDENEDCELSDEELLRQFMEGAIR